MNKENFFIKQFDSKYIGDDGAVVGNLVYAQDSFFEDIHFSTSFMSLEQIVKKSIIVNLSDAIVMNAKPLYLLISCAVPSYFTPLQLKILAQSFNRYAKAYNVQIIGGDTIKSDKLYITITTISQTKNPIYRTGIKQGDLIAYTSNRKSDLGKVKKNLSQALRFKYVNSHTRFIAPILRGDFFYQVAKYIHSALDISDGLCVELQRLSVVNHIGFYFFKPIHKNIGCSGEEYEILLAFPPKHYVTIQRLAQKYRLQVHIIAKAIRGSFDCTCSAHHF